MADLATSAVTINDTWYEGDRAGKRKFFCRDLTLVLTGQGTDSNAIDAATLGFASISRVEDVRANGDTLQTGSPNYAGTKVLLYRMIQATDATRQNPADITDTIHIVVKGRET